MSSGTGLPTTTPTVSTAAETHIVRKAAKKGIVYDIHKVEDKAKLKTLVLQEIQQRRH